MARGLSGARVLMFVVGLVIAILPLGPAHAVTAERSATRFNDFALSDLNPPVAGSRVLFSDTLMTQDEQPVAGRAVELWVRRYGAPEFRRVASVTSGAAGRVAARVLLARSARYKWVFRGDATYARATSMTYWQEIATRVGITLDDATVTKGSRVVARGVTYPAKPGRTIRLYAGCKPLPLSTCQPRVLAAATVAGDGRYRLVWKPGSRGNKRVFVGIGVTAGNAPGYSAYRWVGVS